MATCDTVGIERGRTPRRGRIAAPGGAAAPPARRPPQLPRKRRRPGGAAWEHHPGSPARRAAPGSGGGRPAARDADGERRERASQPRARHAGHIRNGNRDRLQPRHHDTGQPDHLGGGVRARIAEQHGCLGTGRPELALAGGGARTRSPATSPLARCQPAAVQTSVSDDAWRSGAATGAGVAMTQTAPRLATASASAASACSQSDGRDCSPPSATPTHGMPATTRARAITNPRSHFSVPGEITRQASRSAPRSARKPGSRRARKIHVAGVVRATRQRDQRLQQRQPARRTAPRRGKQGDPAVRQPTRGEHIVEHRHRGGPRACLLRQSATAKCLGTVAGSKCRQSGGQGIGHRSSLG